jgi:phthalate 4,5-dioxygenase
MLSREDNELLTRIGLGTAMGALFRRHWLPFQLADELVADAPPVRVRLLGEALVAFRDSRGRAGLLGEHCPHRRASLAFGQNEAGGLRCGNHGWKFDIEGRCLDMPSEPAGSAFRERVRAAAYPVLERGGLLWAYLGPAEKRAEPPDFEWLGAPAAHRRATHSTLACNYAQALEGEVDASRDARASARRYTVHETAYGLACGARSAASGSYAWRVDLFLIPCFTLRAPAEDPETRVFRAWVPIDDERTSVFTVAWRAIGAPLAHAPASLLAESAGPIADRAGEHLGTSDKAIVALRNRMLSLARRLAEGLEPQTPYDPDAYRVRAYAGAAGADERDFIEQEAIRRAMLAP